MTGLFGPALAAAFLGGLAGGLHCAGMCGGIVGALCQPSVKASRTGAWRHLVAYNAGRIASYTVAGMLAGALGAAGFLTRGAIFAQPLVVALASVMLIALGLSLAGITPIVRRIEVLGAWLWRLIQPWTGHLLPVTSIPRALALGALWGWLPCGMVYAVLVTALALGNWWQGALVLFAFGIGTLPNLLGIGLFWQNSNCLARARVPRLAVGVTIAAFGIYGLMRAGHHVAMAGHAVHVSNWLP
jgi:sulfite exporter TauE/SafE